MVKTERKEASSEAVGFEPEAARYFKQAIVSGKHWCIALLEAIRLWDLAEENHAGRAYRYLIDGEALDWLLLAERLCGAVDSQIPESEMTALLFHGELPVKLSTDEFRELIGEARYRQYLNYYYGVTVEEALVLAVQEEIQKERRAAGLTGDSGAVANEAFRRIYDATRTILLRSFRKQKGYPQPKSISLTELKEFTYWLFKYRIQHSEKAKMASDTKKALLWLNRQSFARETDLFSVSGILQRADG